MLAASCVWVFVHLYMYVLLVINVCVCVCVAAAPSGLACVYLGPIPDLHHFSADSSIPPSLCPSGYLQVYRRLLFPACQHPILFIPSPLLSMLSSFALSHIFLCPNVCLKRRKKKKTPFSSLAVSQNRSNDGQVCVHLHPFLILSFVLLVVRVLICVALEHSFMNKSDDSAMKV